MSKEGKLHETASMYGLTGFALSTDNIYIILKILINTNTFSSIMVMWQYVLQKLMVAYCGTVPIKIRGDCQDC